MENESCKRGILIGGITGGIGRALALHLHEHGWPVAGFSKQGERSDLPREIPVWAADARDSRAVKESFRKAADCLDGIHAYVHAIGSVFLKPAHRTTDEEWEAVYATNLHSAFVCAREAVDQLRRAQGGRIVLFSSAAAQIGLLNHDAIAAAKGGIDGLTRSLAATYAPFGVRVNAVAPGLVPTPATAALTGSADARKISAAMHPTGSIGTPEAIASLVTWLLSPEAEWMTGQIVSLDGGMSAVMPRLKVG